MQNTESKWFIFKYMIFVLTQICNWIKYPQEKSTSNLWSSQPLALEQLALESPAPEREPEPPPEVPLAAAVPASFYCRSSDCAGAIDAWLALALPVPWSCGCKTDRRDFSSASGGCTGRGTCVCIAIGRRKCSAPVRRSRSRIPWWRLNFGFFF